MTEAEPRGEDASAAHRSLMELFFATVELPTAAQQTYLQQHCGDHPERLAEVSAMLRADREDADLLEVENVHDLAARVAWVPGESEATDNAPTQIGPYQVIESIGRGGMATVYRARQLSPARDVAVKLMDGRLWSADGSDRFLQEAELLGRLQHPGIAQVYESGSAEIGGQLRPFLAMEWVRGLPLDQHAATLSRHQVLRLFRDICLAVHHAHQKGVIHRDLKPANVMVNEEGLPKVLDFGIGRLVSAEATGDPHQTRPGTILGTLAYMSPEQADGRTDEVDTRSDVYALGVMLFELCCGRLPIEIDDGSITANVQRIQQERPRRLGELDPALAGSDLELLIAKALAKEPEARYASAAAFAEDLRRYLDREPIEARPPSRLYLLRRFVARNRVLTALTVTAALSLAIGTALATSWAVEAEASATAMRRTNQRPQREQQTNEEVIHFVEALFSSATPAFADGEVPSIKEIVDAGRTSLGGTLSSDPQVAARLRAFFGGVYLAVGDTRLAQQQIEAALGPLTTGLGADHPRVLTSRVDQAQILARDPARAGEARRSYQHLLTLLPADRQTTGLLRARCLTGLGFLARARQDWPSAESRLSAAVALLDRIDAPAGLRAGARADLATVFTLTQRLEQAAQHCTEALSLLKNGGPRVVRSRLLEAQGNILARSGKIPAAEAAFRTCLELREKTHGPEHPSLVQSIQNLAAILARQGKTAAAEELLRRAVGIADRHPGTAPESIAQALQNLGNCRAVAQDAKGAMDFWTRALDLQTKIAGPDSAAAASLYAAMAWAHQQLGDPEAAAAAGARAQKIRSRLQRR